MAGSARAEPASSGHDGPTSAARGGHAGASLDRPGSFREGLETRSSGTGASRSGVEAAAPVSQCLNLEPLSLQEQKYTRYNELRRVLGVTLEEQHSFGSLQARPLHSTEDVKRFRSSLQEQSTKARDRRKLLSDSILKLDKYRNVLSKKQQRNEVLSSEKSGNSASAKVGGQAHQSHSDLASQRPEERPKNGVSNRRARSLVVEVRSEGRNAVASRPGIVGEKDKHMLLDNNRNVRASNGPPMPSEDKVRGLPVGGDGWEKKLKRKRSVGTMVSRVPDNDRELKQSIQQRSSNEVRQRSSDGLGFRPGSTSGFTGANKLDSSLQLSGMSSRVSPRNDMDTASLPSDRRERFAGLDKERFMAKGSNQLTGREDTQVGGQIPMTKGKASRAPRTGSGVVKSTPNFPRSSGGSSSPPVAQWAGQRPQKISRTRRANIVSPVFDDAQVSSEGCSAPDVGSRLTTMESTGTLNAGGMPNHTHQLKLKFENVASPAGISESEESGTIENKSKDKGTDDGDVDDGALNDVHRAPTLVLPVKENIVILKEDIGDCVRRQGRSGRGSVQSKGSLPVRKERKEKSQNIYTTKPLKSGRPGSDKSESQAGRPSKKASDRKAYTRHGQIISSGSSEMTGESDDDWDELVAAANFARNASYLGCSSSFWKKMEPMFSLISPKDINHVKCQVGFAEEVDESLCNTLNADHTIMGGLVFHTVSSTQTSASIEQVSQDHTVGLQIYDGAMPIKGAPEKLETKRWLEKMIPLSQRLLSAFIVEDETEKPDLTLEQGDAVLQFSSDSSPYCVNSHTVNEQGAELMNYQLDLGLDSKHSKKSYSGKLICGGPIGSSNFGSPTIQFTATDEVLEGHDALEHVDTGNLSETRQTNSGLTTGSSGTSLFECQFEHMSLDERILLELQSIGLYPETVPDLAEGEDEEIDKVISELKMRLYQQVGNKKSQLYKLEKAIQVGEKIDVRNLEHLAMNKLVESAYKKLLGGRGSHGSSHKNGASKLSKQLALAFAKRTLSRCELFEKTGRSCFSEPTLQDVMVSPAPYRNDAKSVVGICSVTATNIYTHSSQLGSRVSSVTSISEKHGASYRVDRPIHGRTHMSDQPFPKTDLISNRGKKKEVLLDDVSAVSRVTSTSNRIIPGGANWKKSDKDRDQNKETLTKNSCAKAGCPSSGTGRGERKTKTKLKQKIAQLSTAGNGLGRVTETSFVLPSTQESCETLLSSSYTINQEADISGSGSRNQDMSKEVEDSIFTNMPLHGLDSIDELDVADGLGGQGQDIASWLNVDEDALQDHDLMGLEIPMDDLSELKLNF